MRMMIVAAACALLAGCGKKPDLVSLPPTEPMVTPAVTAPKVWQDQETVWKAVEDKTPEEVMDAFGVLDRKSGAYISDREVVTYRYRGRVRNAHSNRPDDLLIQFTNGKVGAIQLADPS